MKVEVNVSKDSLIVDVDGMILDVYGDLSKEMVEDVIRKSVWLSSISYEVKRRLTRFSEVEKKSYMTHWREWAIKWAKVKGLKDTQENINDCVAKIFGDILIKEKIRYLFDIRGMLRKDTDKFDTWGDFFNDDDISEDVKRMCKEMYKIEFEKKMNYEKVIELEARMATIVASLRDASVGYKMKSEQEKSMRF